MPGAAPFHIDRFVGGKNQMLGLSSDVVRHDAGIDAALANPVLADGRRIGDRDGLCHKILLFGFSVAWVPWPDNSSGSGGGMVKPAELATPAVPLNCVPPSCGAQAQEVGRSVGFVVSPG